MMIPCRLGEFAETRYHARQITAAEEKAMVVTLGPELETALKEQASRQGIAPELLAVNVLRERLLAAAPLEPRDEWERGLLAAARPCGVSLSNAALSSEELYD